MLTCCWWKGWLLEQQEVVNIQQKGSAAGGCWALPASCLQSLSPPVSSPGRTLCLNVTMSLHTPVPGSCFTVWSYSLLWLMAWLISVFFPQCFRPVNCLLCRSGGFPALWVHGVSSVRCKDTAVLLLPPPGCRAAIRWKVDQEELGISPYETGLSNMKCEMLASGCSGEQVSQF